MRIVYLIFIVLIMASCGSDETRERAEMIEKVMAIHDEVMPEMGKINSFRRDALHQAEVLFSDSLKANDEDAMVLENLAIELEAANESMMAWMRSYHNNFEDMEHEEVMDYLKEKEKEINEVKVNMLGAIEKAEETLGN